MTPKIGKNIESWCTRCKQMLAHTIEVVVGAKITRVYCHTCGGQHGYRPAPPVARADARNRVNGAAASDQKRRSEYEVLLGGRTASAAQPYAQSSRFKVRDLIVHDTFGLGAVTAERDHIKIDVLFPDGPRVLMHGR